MGKRKNCSKRGGGREGVTTPVPSPPLKNFNPTPTSEDNGLIHLSLKLKHD